MSKTVEEIKDEVAKEYIKSGERSTIEQLMTEVAKRYAKSQTQELQEQNAELVSALKNILDFKKYQREEDFISIEELDELLNKYNHLKSNTNESNNKI